MSVDLRGIHQQSLFSRQLMMSVVIAEESRYRVLSNVLPWSKMAEVANSFRARTINIHNGRRLDLRLHLGAYIAQSMNGWTDRETEEMVRYHVGVRFLCGLEESSNSIDRTSVEYFRTTLGKDGSEALNQLIVRTAAGAGFTGSELCASDTTVQESPIAYPTEVGHMKNIAEKLLGIGKKLRGNLSTEIENLHKKAKDIFTEIRLFTRGKGEEILQKKKDLSQKMHKIVKSMAAKVSGKAQALKGKVQLRIQNDVQFYQHMLGQIQQWLKTGFHPKDKILSLWERSARAISKGKVGKSAEFGRRWIITRLLGGYVIGAACQKLGADADTGIADEVMLNFIDTLGEIPELFVFDRGADSEKNRNFLAEIGVAEIGIFPKGRRPMDVSSAALEVAKKERSLNEASIATLKHSKYNFTKPRARSTSSCELKGHFAMLGVNLTNLLRDVSQTWSLNPEIT